MKQIFYQIAIEGMGNAFGTFKTYSKRLYKNKEDAAKDVPGLLERCRQLKDPVTGYTHLDYLDDDNPMISYIELEYEGE